MPQIAYHDGSALYVSNPNPVLGETVTLYVRVRGGAGITGVAVRSLLDGEPNYVHAVPSVGPVAGSPAGTAEGSPAGSVAGLAGDGQWQWFEAEVTIRNPVHSYRVLLKRDGGYSWLNAQGIFDHDVADTANFRITTYGPAPDWALQGVLYQVFPDRFARSAQAMDVLAADPQGVGVPDWAVPQAWNVTPQASAPQTPYELYGGDLRGVAEHLDYLQDLGVTCVYFTPLFPARSNHRYDAESFEVIDPILGGNEALAEFTAAAHARGMTVMGDLTTNHTGVTHEWFERAAADPDTPERSYYYFDDSELGYEAWLGIYSLPKLNWASPQLRQEFIEGADSVVGKWLQAPYLLDGWRIDVAHMTGRRGADDFYGDVQLAVRKTMDDLVADGQSYLAAEYFHDPTGDLNGDGWHANMNYSGFTRPIWNWLVRPGTTLDFLGIPTPIPSRTGAQVVATIREFQSHVPHKVTLAQWNMLDSHDTPRIRTVVGTVARAKVAAVAQLTFPGVPVLWMGDELGGQGVNGEHSRTGMPWLVGPDGGHTGELDPAAFAQPGLEDLHADDDGAHLGHTTAGSFVDLRDHYRELIALRKSSDAFITGSMRWVLADDDAIAFVRESAHEQILVVLTREAYKGVIAAGDLALFGPAGPAGSAADAVLFACGGSEAAWNADGSLAITAPAAGAVIIRL